MSELDAGFFSDGISAPKRFRLRIVADERCPSCREEGSPKVCDLQGRWHWKCLSPYSDCKVGYWLPGYGERYIEMKLPPAQAKAEADRIRNQIDEQMKFRRWICNCNGSGIATSRTIPMEEPIPDGWHPPGKACTD